MAFRKTLLITLLLLFTNTAFLFGYHELGYQYLNPKPDASHVYKGTTLIIRFENISPADLDNLSSFVTVKNQSGRICNGSTKIASDNRTVIFTPDNAFDEGETVLVSLSPSVRSSAAVTVDPITYQFVVSASIIHKIPEPEGPVLGKTGPERNLKTSQAMTFPNGVSVPSDFPRVQVTWSDNPDDGYIFIDNRGGNMGQAPAYNIIFDNTGSPVWYWRVPDERRDFKVQPNGWATMMIRDGYGGSYWGYIAIDNHYNYVKTFRATNGYYADEHELRVLADGGYLLIGRKDEYNVDMSQIVNGGQKNVFVQSTCIQEYTAADELIFEWSAWENQDIRDVQFSDIYSNHIYFSHMNSIDFDEDGNLILSSRELCEVCKIHRQTGDFIWRLGGVHNEFTFINDPLQGFSMQHTARVLGNNVYSVFDNGNLHNPPVSRAVKYKLDTAKKTATLIWQFTDTPPTHSFNMGNVQQLPNGNVLINWARTYLPKLTEVRPDGSKAFEMNFTGGFECYRVHRCAWNGMSGEPRLEYELYPDNLTLIFNKFGDPDVDYYNIYAGLSPNPTEVYDTSRVSMKKITTLPNGQYWFRVTAVSTGGQESGYSNEESVYVSFTQPGENLVQNGDFSNNTADWIFELQGSGQGGWSVENGEAHIVINDGGSNDFDVQLRQNAIPLITGNTYIFEFDGRADATRLIGAKVGQDQSPFTNYSKSTSFSLRPLAKHFSYEFEMEDPSDFNARIVFNMGTSDIDVYLDNISLKQKLEQWAYSGSPYSIPGLIQCEEYDFGGEGFAYHDDSTKDGDSEFRPQDNVDVEAAVDEEGDYNVGWTNSGEWLEYTVNAESGIYDIEYRTASDLGGGVLDVLLDDQLLCEFNVPATGGWQEYITLIQSDIWINGGNDLVLRLDIIEGYQNMNWLKFTKTASDIEQNTVLPEAYRLLQNTPNPFNPDTRIEYQLPERNHVLIQVVNVLGKQVKTLIDQKQEPGSYHVTWDGTNTSGFSEASGIYLVRMQSGDFHAVRKVTLLK